jgi:peptide/nickel transport system permease protein
LCRELGSAMLRHILPNVIGTLVVQATLNVGFAILVEAGLSFLGLGVQPPTPTWGGMVSEGRKYIFTAAYIGLVPGLFIMLASLACNLVGDSLRDALDPRSKLHAGG